MVTVLAVTPLVLERGGPYLPHSAQGWLVIVAMAFGYQLLGHGLVVYAIESLPVSFTSQALLTPPVLSGAAALRLFGELPNLSQLAGAALVLTGLCLGARRSKRKRNYRMNKGSSGTMLHSVTFSRNATPWRDFRMSSRR
jgi:drug/metabolite transporter (DMT)-like permease